jgi:hypothetical protein
MQRDSSTYCDEPEEREEYGVWKASFRLEGASGEIDKITRENPFMAELQSRIVPLIVEHDDFWHRYFYRCAASRPPVQPGSADQAAANTRYVGPQLLDTYCCSQDSGVAPPNQGRQNATLLKGRAVDWFCPRES